MKNFNEKILKPEINEEADRPTKRDRGRLYNPKDTHSWAEDEARVNENDPEKKYIPIDEIADPRHDYINYGEGKNEYEYDSEEIDKEETNNERLYTANKEDDFFSDDYYSEEDKTVIDSDNEFLTYDEVSEERDKDILEEERQDEELSDKRRRLVSERVEGMELKGSSKRVRSYNKKTISDSKKARDNRGEIREKLGK